MVNFLVKLLFANIFKEMNSTCIFFFLTMLTDDRKLGDSNTLGGALEVYRVDK